MEILKENLATFVGLLLSGFVGWLFGKPKQRLELQSGELDNVDKAVKIYRQMIEDLSHKYAQAITDLKEANQRIQTLEATITNLLQKLKHFTDEELNEKLC